MADSLAIALDLGTTSIKGAVLSQAEGLHPMFVESAPLVTQSENRFESDALDYLAVCNDLLSRCLAAAKGNPPLGLSVQRSSFVIWDKSSGQPVTPLISWQDSRAEQMCRTLEIEKISLREITGLWLTPYFFAPKLAYVLAERPDWQTGLEQGKLLVGTLDSFVIWHWSEGKAYWTDLSMAARTLLVDTARQKWSNQLARVFDLSIDYLPSTGATERIGVSFKQGIVLQASVADQSAAVLAAIPRRRGDVLVNLGTGGFVCCFIDECCTIRKLEGYQRTLVYLDSDHNSHFIVEATINSIGRALDSYACQNYSIDGQNSLHDYFCLAEPGGLGAPYFREDITFCFSKSVEDLDHGQIAGLILEGIVFRVAQILDDFNRICGIDRVFLSGGWSRLASLQQGIARCSPVDVYVLEEKECSLLGAALLATEKSGLFRAKDIKVEQNNELKFLNTKYSRWQSWLACLLEL